ncbi:hypothetical protein [Desulfospira joergensenii]|uniref:hypothetical protein n=1 Tax=Desulfospira joergensenii TaxID=53329 RepID=UPI0003B3B3E6|nr:hypothetical protein [Desulfospira joergensenii]
MTEQQQASPTCFIIMPITTPAQYVDLYKGDTNHFRHVLDHLFIPAIEEAGLEPIPPISKGASVIHGDIVRNIETADLVLCDMSILNPNVFFELGIRTALNKAVAMVRDNVSEQVPFDTTIVNYHEYVCGFDPWVLPKQIEKLTSHQQNCMERTTNSLWSYFSMSQQAEVPSDAPDMDQKLAYLIKQVESLKDQANSTSRKSLGPAVRQTLIKKNIEAVLEEYNLDYNMEIIDLTGSIEVLTDHEIPSYVRGDIIHRLTRKNYSGKLQFVVGNITYAKHSALMPE